MAELNNTLINIKNELDYRRRINPLQFFQPIGLQKNFLNDPSKKKAIFGGNRSGKTEPCAVYVLQKCLANPAQRWWACAESFADSVNIQQRKIYQLLPKTEILYGKYDEINGFANRKLLLKNKSIIIFKSYDQEVENFQGEDLDGCWFDEEPPFGIYKEVLPRLLDRDGELIFSMTALKGMTDLIQNIFENADIVKSEYSAILKETLPRIASKDGMKFFLLWTTENNYIDQDRLQKEIKLLSRQEILPRVFGLPINLYGKIYTMFSSDVHVVPLEQIPKKKVQLYCILDPHDAKPWAIKWIILDATETGYCVAEYPADKNFNEIGFDDKTIEEYADIIKQQEKKLKEIFNTVLAKRIIDPNFGNRRQKQIVRDNNLSAATIKTQLQRYGLDFADGNDALAEGHLKVREKLNYYCKGLEIVQQPKYFILETCQNSIRHLSRYSWKDEISKEDNREKNKPQEKYKDFCDLDRYFWMSNPKYTLQTDESMTYYTAAKPISNAGIGW